MFGGAMIVGTDGTMHWFEYWMYCIIYWMESIRWMAFRLHQNPFPSFFAYISYTSFVEHYSSNACTGRTGAVEWDWSKIIPLISHVGFHCRHPRDGRKREDAGDGCRIELSIWDHIQLDGGIDGRGRGGCKGSFRFESMSFHIKRYTLLREFMPESVAKKFTEALLQLTSSSFRELIVTAYHRLLLTQFEVRDLILGAPSCPKIAIKSNDLSIPESYGLNSKELNVCSPKYKWRTSSYLYRSTYWYFESRITIGIILIVTEFNNSSFPRIVSVFNVLKTSTYISSH